jgi:hypothetical protein
VDEEVDPSRAFLGHLKMVLGGIGGVEVMEIASGVQVTTGS